MSAGNLPGSDASGSQRLRLAQSIIDSDAAAVAEAGSQLGQEFLDVVEILLNCTGKVLVCGMGTSGASARRVAHLLSVGGTPALYVSAADGLHGGLGSVAAKDVVIAISRGGESDELNEFAKRARERGAVVVALTSDSGCTLAKTATHQLIVTTSQEYDYGGLIAMGSALAQCAVGDALAAVAMQARDNAWGRFEHSHPGGAVGKYFQEEGERA